MILKTLWEKEKMLVTSIFSFSHNIFYSIKGKNQFFSHIQYVIYNSFNLDKSNIFFFI